MAAVAALTAMLGQRHMQNASQTL